MVKSLALIVASSIAIASAEERTPCGIAIANKVTPILTGQIAAPCAKTIGATDLSLAFVVPTSHSDAEKLLNSEDCKLWYQNLSAAIKSVDPPCTYEFQGTPIYTTNKYNWTFEYFLKVHNESAVKDANQVNATTTKPSVTNTTNSSKPTTNTVTTTKPDQNSGFSPTSAPSTTKSSSATLALAMSTLVMAAYLFN